MPGLCICLLATTFGGNSVYLYAKRHTIVTSRLYRRLNGYFERKKKSVLFRKIENVVFVHIYLLYHMITTSVIQKSKEGVTIYKVIR